MPKVLITNGKRPCTWYSGREGKVYPISSFSDTHFHTLVFGSGTVQKEDGELLYTESEYNKVAQQRDKMINDLERHANELVRLRRELERANELNKPVELPREVADSIEDCRRAGMDDLTILASLNVIHQLFRDYSSSVLNSLKVIRKYSNKLGCSGRLLESQANGYTVEESPEERLQTKVVELLLELFPDDTADCVEIQETASKIVGHAKQLT